MENQNENTKEQIIETPATQTEVTINQEKLNLYIEELKLDQNLSFGVVAGLAASIVSAVLWAVITVATEYQIGYMAIAVGLIVGFTVRWAGKGFDKIFGIAGALLALLGCLLGNFLSMIGFIANAQELGYFETLSLFDYSLITDLMIETADPMDLLFYGFAIYEGYKFSFRKLTEQEIMANAVDHAGDAK